MKTLKESIKDIEGKYIEIAKYIENTFQRNINILEDGCFESLETDEIIKNEDEINSLEMRIKEEAIITIARFQPAACDLRRLITLINSAKTMERIGDLLKANTCLTKEISKKYPQLVIYLGNEILFLVKEVKKIYELYNKSFLYSDVENMHKILNLDLDINKIVKKNYEIILEKMTENPEIIKGGFLLLMLNKKYERISDHIIHMDKDLIYASTGKNIRKMQLMGKI